MPLQWEPDLTARLRGVRASQYVFSFFWAPPPPPLQRADAATAAACNSRARHIAEQIGRVIGDKGANGPTGPSAMYRVLSPLFVDAERKNEVEQRVICRYARESDRWRLAL